MAIVMGWSFTTSDALNVTLPDEMRERKNASRVSTACQRSTQHGNDFSCQLVGTRSCLPREKSCACARAMQSILQTFGRKNWLELVTIHMYTITSTRGFMSEARLPIHPYAELFPPMGHPEFDRLCGDIATNGLQEPIVLHEGKVLEGRNRYLACLARQVPPHFRDYAGECGSPRALVGARNTYRRHLTATPR